MGSKLSVNSCDFTYAEYSFIWFSRWPVFMTRVGKSGIFREFNSQKIFLKTRFDRKYLGKHHGADAPKNTYVLYGSSNCGQMALPETYKGHLPF